ncbi:MAG: nitroreductase family protein [Clostridia bacterium]|nr:nitroreductase family protein [Clostridia bacterium]
MLFKELIDKNRSHREFASGNTAPREAVREWILNASHCPAAMNMQTLKYKIVDDTEQIAKILPITRWGTSLPDKKLPPKGHEPTTLIVICHDNTISPMKPIFMIDIGICAQTIMLSAAEQGFGGCIIGSASTEDLKQSVELPENLQPMLLLGIGAPEDTVVLTAFEGSTKYYRDQNNVHYVPKRSLDEIIIE